jgi:hypothetical protein
MDTARYLLRTLADINELHFIIQIASLLGYVARNPTTNVDKLQSTFDILIEADTKLNAVEQTSRTTTNPNLESITRDLINVEETLLKAMGQIDPAIEQHLRAERPFAPKQRKDFLAIRRTYREKMAREEREKIEREVAEKQSEIDDKLAAMREKRDSKIPADESGRTLADFTKEEARERLLSPLRPEEIGKSNAQKYIDNIKSRNSKTPIASSPRASPSRASSPRGSPSRASSPRGSLTETRRGTLRGSSTETRRGSLRGGRRKMNKTNKKKMNKTNKKHKLKFKVKSK